MKRTGLLIVKNVLEQTRDIKRSSLFFFLPIAIFLCLYIYFNVNDIELNFVKPLKVGVVVEDSTIYTQMLVDDFESKKDLSRFFQLEQDKRQVITEKFENEELDGMIIIPEGFFEAILYFDDNPIEVRIHQDDPIAATILYNGFLAYEQYIISVEKSIIAFYETFRSEVTRDEYVEYNDALSIELIMTMLNRNELYDFNEVIEIPSASSLDYYFVAITVMFIFLMALFSSTQWIKDRQTQVFRRMTLTNISIEEYILSRWFGDFAFVGGMMLLWNIIYGLTVNGSESWISSLLFLFLLVLTSVAVTSCLTIVLTDTSDMVLVSSVFVFFSSVLGGSIIPIHYLPEGLKTISSFTPNYVVIKHILFLKAGIDQQGGWVLISLMILMIIGCFFILRYYYQERLKRGSHG